MKRFWKGAGIVALGVTALVLGISVGITVESDLQAEGEGKPLHVKNLFVFRDGTEDLTDDQKEHLKAEVEKINRMAKEAARKTQKSKEQ